MSLFTKTSGPNMRPESLKVPHSAEIMGELSAESQSCRGTGVTTTKYQGHKLAQVPASRSE